MRLEEHNFFTVFSDEIKTQIIHQSEILTFPPQHIIFQEGDVSDYLYLVLDGTVSIVRGSISEPQVIAQAQKNDYFGEYGILDNNQRSAGAVASDEVKLARIPKDVIVQSVQKISSYSELELLRHLISNVRTTTDKYIQNIVYKTKTTVLGEMLNSILHDFRNPFTVIRMATYAIQNIHDDKECVYLCKLIEEQITRMNFMAEEILDFSRGNYTMNIRPIKVSDALDYFVFLNKVYLTKCDIELEVSTVDAVLSLDMNKFQRILQNLVNNAVEIFKGRKDGHIAVIAKDVDKGVEIEIRDNGPGIPESIRNNIFKPFTTYGKKKGIGLGLAITKSLVEAHNGKISVKTETDIGTSFFLWFPIHQPL